MKRAQHSDAPEPRKSQRVGTEVVAEIVDAGENVPEVDEFSIKVSVQTLEKAICRNQEARLRYSDEPLKFQSTEEDLFNAILKFKTIPDDLSSLSLVLDSSGLENLVGLLGHSNPDIITCVFEVLLDWCDSDTPSETQQYVLSRLVSAEIVPVVSCVLERTRISRDSDSELIYSALSMLENVYESKPEEMEKESVWGVAKWLLRQLEESDEEFSTNKLYIAELLSVILAPVANQAKVASFRGVESLLKAIITVAGIEVRTEDERELVENLFDCLGKLLLDREAVGNFRRSKGLAVVLKLMKVQKPIPDLALKTLDIALQGSAELASELIQESGLRTFFPFFMRSSRKSVKAQCCVLSILFSLYKNTPEALKERLHCKLTENECEKLHLIRFYYEQFSEQVGEDAEDPLALQALQHISFIVASLWQKPQMHAYLQDAFNIEKVREVLNDWERRLGDEEVTGVDLRTELPRLHQGLV